MAINQAVVCGNLTKDAQGRKVGDSIILNFTVAVNEPYKDGDTWTTKPHYIGCVMFGTRAEKIKPYLVKGTRVTVAGSLRYSEWMKDDEKRSRIEILVKDIEFMSRKDDNKDEVIPF